MTEEQLAGRWIEFLGKVRRALGKYAGNERWVVEGESRMALGHEIDEAAELDHYEHERTLNAPPARPRVFGK